MKGIHNTYCNPNFLDKIIKERKNNHLYAIAYNMIYRLSNVIIDMPKDELKELIKGNEEYNRLNKRDNKSIKSQEWIKNFSPNSFLCDDIFLIEEDDIKDYKKVREKYGCLIIALETNELKAFERYSKGHPFNLVPQSDRIKDPTITIHNSWKKFFAEFRMTPLNAVILTDNFMFGVKFESRKQNSLFEILKAIAPKNLEIDFHITIFFNNSNNSFEKNKAEQLIKDIKNLKLCKSVKVTIVAHTIKSTTHDRELITNYHYMYSGVGFSVVDGQGVQEVAKGQVQHIFCDMESNVTIKQLQAEVVTWLKPIFDNKKGGGLSSYIVGDKINRLFID